MKKKKKLIIAIIVLIILIAAVFFCYFKFGKKSKIKISNDGGKISIEKEPEVQIVNLKSKTRPYAVMINNLNDARRVQSGLSKAYIVYELLAEGGISRFLALFRDVEVELFGITFIEIFKLSLLMSFGTLK